MQVSAVVAATEGMIQHFDEPLGPEIAFLEFREMTTLEQELTVAYLIGKVRGLEEAITERR